MSLACPSCAYPEQGRIYKEPDGKMFLAAPGSKVNTQVTDPETKEVRIICEETVYQRCLRCGQLSRLVPDPAARLVPLEDAEAKAVDAALTRSLGEDRNWPAILPNEEDDD